MNQVTPRNQVGVGYPVVYSRLLLVSDGEHKKNEAFSLRWEEIVRPLLWGGLGWDEMMLMGSFTLILILREKGHTVRAYRHKHYQIFLPAAWSIEVFFWGHKCKEIGNVRLFWNLLLRPATESNPYIRPIWHKLGPIAIVIIPGVSNGCFTFMAPWKPVINVAMELWTPISTRKELRYYCTFKKTCVMRKVSLNGCQSCQIPQKDNWTASVY